MGTTPRRTRVTKSSNDKTVIPFADIDEYLKKKIAEEEGKKCPEEGEYYTSMEIAKMRGTHKSTAVRWIKKCYEVGILEVGEKIIKKIDGTKHLCVAYKFKDLKLLKNDSVTS